MKTEYAAMRFLKIDQEHYRGFAADDDSTPIVEIFRIENPNVWHINFSGDVVDGFSAKEVLDIGLFMTQLNAKENKL